MPRFPLCVLLAMPGLLSPAASQIAVAGALPGFDVVSTAQATGFVARSLDKLPGFEPAMPALQSMSSVTSPAPPLSAAKQPSLRHPVSSVAAYLAWRSPAPLLAAVPGADLAVNVPQAFSIAQIFDSHIPALAIADSRSGLNGFGTLYTDRAEKLAPVADAGEPVTPATLAAQTDTDWLTLVHTYWPAALVIPAALLALLALRRWRKPKNTESQADAGIRDVPRAAEQLAGYASEMPVAAKTAPREPVANTATVENKSTPAPGVDQRSESAEPAALLEPQPGRNQSMKSLSESPSQNPSAAVPGKTDIPSSAPDRGELEQALAAAMPQVSPDPQIQREYLLRQREMLQEQMQARQQSGNPASNPQEAALAQISLATAPDTLTQPVQPALAEMFGDEEIPKPAGLFGRIAKAATDVTPKPRAKKSG